MRGDRFRDGARLRLLLAISCVAMVGLALQRLRPSRERSAAGEKSSVSRNGYETLGDCALIPHRGNDGDSFHLRHGARDLVFRLYFVDAPETNLRYAQRVADQAAYFGGLSLESTVRIGQAAKDVTSRILSGERFEVHTRWKRVMDSNRYHAFIHFPDRDANEQWLAQRLVNEGLARIHTWGDDLPTGTSWRVFREELREREKVARQAGRGGWAPSFRSGTDASTSSER